MNGNARKDGVSGWTTRDEKHYIETIGEYKKLGQQDSATVYGLLTPTRKLKYKIKMLKGYLAGTGKRVNWGTIDAGEVIDFVKRELARMEG